MDRVNRGTNRINGVSSLTSIKKLGVGGSGMTISRNSIQGSDPSKRIKAEMKGRIERGRGEFGTFGSQRDVDRGRRNCKCAKALKDNSYIVERKDGTIIDGNNV